MNTALVSAESLSFEDALFLLHERGKAMQEAVPLGKGSMIAVLGIDSLKLNDLLNNFKKNIEEFVKLQMIMLMDKLL